jgi:hypothetical protein|tara:strand:- start:2158 stop:3786 length:1629 start_codon:yes stop_codon:yes gene_type:complete
MTEVAVVALLGGCAYLISNQKKNSVENFEDQNNVKKNKIINDNLLQTSMNPTSNVTLRNTMDKYVDNTKNLTNQKESFKSEYTHNNMVPFYNNNSYGYDNESYANDSRLDTYTGMGSQSFSKQETSTLFKPSDNMQNVYGNQNENDFLQSRVNESNRHANAKPWTEIREGPGELGFNSSVQYRDETRPKTVDELRATNNPKSVYELNYKAPAYKPNQSGKLGKIVKKTPDTYHVNEGMGGMGPAYGYDQPTQQPEQMMTHENRDTTSVMYYGARGGDEKLSYNKPQNEESKKIQLPANPFTNLSSQNVYPTSDYNYGKNGFNILENNRSSKNENYFGNIKSEIVSNVVSPIANGLKYTKRNNLVHNPNPIGNVGGTNKKPIVYNPYEEAPVTNREMMSESINHLNVQNQTSNGYITSNPYVNTTQRQSTNQSYMGNAAGANNMKSYEAQYNQRNIQKPFENRTSVGNMSLFNGSVNASINGHEQSNERGNALYAPSNDTPNSQFLGQMTKQNQSYETKNELDSQLLKAFKENPYTHSLTSVA